ncbi:putative lipoprotein [Vibrio cholerae]|nr:putative lipoprotein [Vibrio cholerae]
MITLFCCQCGTGERLQSWCEDMDEKSKGDWTAKEAGSYAKYCVL